MAPICVSASCYTASASVWAMNKDTAALAKRVRALEKFAKVAQIVLDSHQEAVLLLTGLAAEDARRDIGLSGPPQEDR